MYKILVNYNLAKERKESCKRKKYNPLNRSISIKEIGKTAKELPQEKATDPNISRDIPLNILRSYNSSAL